MRSKKHHIVPVHAAPNLDAARRAHSAMVHGGTQSMGRSANHRVRFQVQNRPGQGG